MITVISHFYNEEFLLPHWLKLHRKVFDHGIMINYGSTDRSVEIIKELCPTWAVVDTINETFHAGLIDYEVMIYEAAIEGWKVCLNTTEFLFPTDLAFTEITESTVYRCMPYILADPEGSWDEPFKGESIFDNLYGFSEYEDNGERGAGLLRGRFVHNVEDIDYNNGRHDINSIYGNGGFNKDLILLYMGDYPRSKEMMKRKLQILTKLDTDYERLEDKQPTNKGHYRTRRDWVEYHDELLAKSKPLTILPHIKGS